MTFDEWWAEYLRDTHPSEYAAAARSAWEAAQRDALIGTGITTVTIVKDRVKKPNREMDTPCSTG
jgi:hypothetical protein